MVRKRVHAVKQKMSVLDRNVRIATYVTLAVTLWMFTGIFSIIWNGMFSNESKSVEHSVQTVLVQTLNAQNYNRTLKVTGKSAPEKLVIVSTETKGAISDILVQRGDKVKAGDIIAKLELNAKTSSLKAAKANLKQAQTRLKSAKELKKEGFAADITLEEAKAQMTLANENLEQIKEDIQNTNITAPIDGIIEKKNFEAGDFVDIGNALFEIVGQKSFLITAHISQKDVSKLKKGQIAEATLANGQKVKGPVRYISGYAESETKTYDIEIETLGEEASLTINSEQIYKPIPIGMTAEIAIPTGETKAHHIPHSALVLSDEGNLGAVYVDEKNIVKFAKVNSLEDMQNGVWIEGLPSKIQLIIRGQGSVKPGEVVKATELKDNE